MKKISQEELNYIKEILSSIALNDQKIGFKNRKLQVLEAEIKQLYQDTFQLEADQKNHMDKLEEKYGKITINLEDGSITKDEKQD
ncbi:MAG: hypothetical protein Unbinned3528contig1000_38 [Prokaryotic dsDNA virus sp.]|nr:MAG: hypothetical protein Unbinned3528contig1000_38 [Prokaryotic dsDNA virus sp.]|tara:strand:- start:21902 stop:22156 length:255 start_codon:yes stop_codon:yes gene_type:complete